MTTYDYLDQPRRLKERIDNKQAELKQYKDMIRNIKAITYEERVQSSLKPDKISASVGKLIDMETELDKVMEKYIDTKETVAKQIDGIANDKQRRVLYYFFIQNYSIEKIENTTEFTRGHIYKIRRDGINSFEKQYMIQNDTK